MDYWRERIAIFTSLLEFFRARNTKVALYVLKAAKHPSIELWSELDIKVTESANEAKDNIKFLSSLEKYTELLYAYDPSECLEIISNLITNVSMIHNISRYYRSPNQIFALLKKYNSDD
jgi:dynein heavy chain